MKVIFLDFDGVLNSRNWMEANMEAITNQTLCTLTDVDATAVKRVNEIIQQTGAVVVVSSTWRLLRPVSVLREVLGRAGFEGVVFGTTPRLSGERGHEIADWLNTHGPVEGYVIIDDSSDMVHLMHKLVQTSWEAGLEDLHIPLAVEMLNQKE